jgi:hypothetical protein
MALCPLRRDASDGVMSLRRDAYGSWCSLRALTPAQGGDNQDSAALRDRAIEAVQKANIRIVDENVHVLAHPSLFVEDTIDDAGRVRRQSRQGITHRAR